MHKGKIITLFILLIVATTGKAQIQSSELKKAALNFVLNGFNKELRHLKILPGSSAITANGDTIAYVFGLAPKGYLVLSADKRISPVIAFSTESNFDFSDNRGNILLQMIKTDLSGRMAALPQIPAEKINENRKLWSNLLENNPSKSGYDIQHGPWLKSVWGGVNCRDIYNNLVYVGNYYTPNHYSPGCVATATAIQLHYFKWPPETGVGYHTDYDNKGNSKGTYYANYGGTRYLWTRMQDKYYYKISYDKTREAMGKLTWHCAIAVDMNFEYGGSSSNLNRVPAAINNHFRCSGHYEAAGWYSFWPRLRENLRNGYPVSIAISNTAGEGHVAVCDGYGQNSGQPRFYHMQFGWWGSYNGWYELQGSWDASGYTIIDGAVFDFLPDPVVGEPVRTANQKEFTLPLLTSKNLSWDSFKIWESRNGGSWTLIEPDYTGTTYVRKVAKSGNYKYKVQAKVNGKYYANSTSEPQEVLVKRDDSALVSLDFDGDDSFFIKDNYFDGLDVTKEYTIECWVKVNKLNPVSNYDVIMDRRGVFSLYLISDSDADYAVRFVTRSSSDAIISSLRSDQSTFKMKFGDWYHIAVTYDSITAALFINGVEVDHGNDAGFRLSASAKALNTGARYWGSYSRYLIGEIDEIRISDTARYAHGKSFTPYRCMPFEPDVNTRLLLHLDEGSGNSLGDDSRNFFNTNLRSSPNYANWKKEAYKPSVIWQKPLTAKEMQKTVVLNWTTIQEENNFGFEVQKSIDGEEWTVLDTVAGKGNSSQPVDYEFTDSDPVLGKNYYRLRQIAPLCRFTFSNTDSVEIVPDGNINIFPNPASGSLTIDGMKGLDVDFIGVYDITGNLLQVDIVNTNTLLINNLPAGVYLLKMEFDNKSVIKKFIVLNPRQ
jgi:hypothetical protein